MKLVLLHGLPGVGKLTVARELSKLTGFKLFHNHLTVDLVQSVFEFGTPAFVELREKIWLDVFARAAEERIDGLIFTFAFERTVRGDFIARVQNVVAQHGGEVLFVRLECSRPELEKRLTDPNRKAYGKLNSLAMFNELDAAGVFTHPEIPDDRLVVDSSDLAPSEVAGRIVAELDLSTANP